MNGTPIKHPDVVVKLTGSDGNAFMIIGLVSKILKKAGYIESAREFQNKAFACASYDALLQLCMETLEVE